jgi:SAM-dependent methyltransferase
MLDQLDKVHLARPATQLYELALATKSTLARHGPRSQDGLPLPPALLRTQIGPLHADASVFLRSGQQHAQLIRDLLEQDGTSLEELDAILDFGCGCGRVLRHWVGLGQVQVFGCDVNPKMVEWCRANLPFVRATVNAESPPFPYASASFDLVYAFSVFTHLTEAAQRSWVDECFRVLRPQGYLLLSTLGEHYAALDRLTASERDSFLRGELVVLYEGSSGTSLCSAYHPSAYVRARLASDFDFVACREAADDGRHDLHLFRKPALTGVSA